MGFLRYLEVISYMGVLVTALLHNGRNDKYNYSMIIHVYDIKTIIADIVVSDDGRQYQ